MHVNSKGLQRWCVRTFFSVGAFFTTFFLGAFLSSSPSLYEPFTCTNSLAFVCQVQPAASAAAPASAAAKQLP